MPPPPAPRARVRRPAAVVRALAPAVLAALALLAVPAVPAGAAVPAVPAPLTGWVWPLDAPHAVSRPFSPGPSPYAPGHRGADLPAAPGAVVRAAGGGRIAYAGMLAGRGVVVVVHGPLRTTYEPVTPELTVGSAVAAGQSLGRLDAGHPGCPVAACLHWGLLRGDTYLDPVRLVRPAAVRLLPRPAAGTVTASARGVAAPVVPVSPRAAAPGASAPTLVQSRAVTRSSYYGDVGWVSVVLALVLSLAFLGWMHLSTPRDERRRRRSGPGRPVPPAARRRRPRGRR